MRQAIIYPGEDGFWVAECPSLPGWISQGETRELAINNIREAIEGYILALQDDGIHVAFGYSNSIFISVHRASFVSPVRKKSASQAIALAR